MKRRWLYMLIALGIALFMAWQVKSRGGVPAELADRAVNYDVEILRDKWGVPHIIGVTDADAAFGLAYAHAEDDFPTVQGSLLAARGRLATVFGSEGAANDFMVALLRTREYSAAGYAALDSTTRALCDGYADGLNVYAARNPKDAIGSLYPVTGQDIVAGFVHKTPLFIGMDRVLQGLFAQDTGRPDADSTEALASTGSNAFAVAPSRSASGNTMLAINSHQPWTGPVAWYEAHIMSSEGLNMLGGTFPGAPLILHGHNENLGWAHTVNAPDLVDLYELTVNPDNDQEYLLDGEWVAFERIETSIPVRLVGLLEWQFEREILWSAHGPAVRTDSGVVAIRFAGWGDAAQVTQWYRMNRATTLDEWYQAMSLQALPIFNTIYADATGQILYIYNARLPIREEGPDWQESLPGDRRDLIWQDYLPFEDLPQVLNPPSGFVQNANSTPYGTTGTSADPVPLSDTFGIETEHTNRSRRALALFGADSSITWEEFREYKYDMRYGPASKAARLIRQIRFATPGDSLTQAAVTILTDWDLGTEPENREAALAMIALRPYLSGDRTIPTAQLLGAARNAARWLLEHHGTLRPEWQEVNRLRRGDLDIGLGGGPDVLHAVYTRPSSDGRLVGYQGDSYVLMVSFEPGGGVRSESIHVFGSATSVPESPHYADQSPLFARRELKSMPFYESDVRSAAVRSYRPGREAGIVATTSRGTISDQ